MKDKIIIRRDGIRSWSREKHPECQKEQKHLDTGTPERAYWHYGYYVALTDVLRLMGKNSKWGKIKTVEDVLKCFPTGKGIVMLNDIDKNHPLVNKEHPLRTSIDDNIKDIDDGRTRVVLKVIMQFMDEIAYSIVNTPPEGE